MEIRWTEQKIIPCQFSGVTYSSHQNHAGHQRILIKTLMHSLTLNLSVSGPHEALSTLSHKQGIQV